MAYNKKDKENFLKVLVAKNFNVSKACKAFNNMSRDTYQQWMKDDPWFKERIDEIKEAEIDEAEELHRIVRRGIPIIKKGVLVGWKVKPDAKALEFYMERIGKDRGYVKRVEKTGKGGTPLNPTKVIAVPMSKKAAKKFLDDLDKSV